MGRELKRGDAVAEGSVVVRQWTTTTMNEMGVGETFGFEVVAAECDRLPRNDERCGGSVVTTNIYLELAEKESVELRSMLGRYVVTNIGDGEAVSKRKRWPITRLLFGEAKPVSLRAA